MVKVKLQYVSVDDFPTCERCDQPVLRRTTESYFSPSRGGWLHPLRVNKPCGCELGND